MLFKELFHLILLIIFLLTYILAYSFVKPFLINRKRKYSTLLLKLTYMVFLAFLLIFVYLFLLFGANRITYHISDIEFFGILLLLFLPNIGILIRRKVKGIRVFYNYLFSVINLVGTYFIILKLAVNNWFLG